MIFCDRNTYHVWRNCVPTSTWMSTHSTLGHSSCQPNCVKNLTNGVSQSALHCGVLGLNDGRHLRVCLNVMRVIITFLILRVIIQTHSCPPSGLCRKACKLNIWKTGFPLGRLWCGSAYRTGNLISGYTGFSAPSIQKKISLCSVWSFALPCGSLSCPPRACLLRLTFLDSTLILPICAVAHLFLTYCLCIFWPYIN